MYLLHKFRLYIIPILLRVNNTAYNKSEIMFMQIYSDVINGPCQCQLQNY